MCTNKECYGRKLLEDRAAQFLMGAVGDARSCNLAPDATQLAKWGTVMLINELLVVFSSSPLFGSATKCLWPCLF